MQDQTDTAQDSPLDAVQLEYIDPKELTDTSELALPEPLANRIADVVGGAVAEAQEWVEAHTKADE